MGFEDISARTRSWQLVSIRGRVRAQNISTILKVRARVRVRVRDRVRVRYKCERGLGLGLGLGISVKEVTGCNPFHM